LISGGLGFMETITTIWVVLALALAFSILLTPFSMHIARHVGAVDVPCGRSVHKEPVPRLGGIGIALSLLFAAAFYVQVDAFVMAFFAGFLIITLTGLIDDINPLSPRFKFMGEILAVVVFVALSGSELTGVGNLFGFGDITFGPLSFIVTVFCMVGLINAMNLADGLDGLAGGLATIAALFFAFLGYETGQINLMVIALSLAGALLGFLLYNGFPARLFMGDVGSLMIGYCCAVLAVQMGGAAPVSGAAVVVQPITIALILAVPLLDTIIVMSLRIIKGGSPFEADNTHLHHRLLGLGLSQNQAVSAIYLMMGLYCSFALASLESPAYVQFYAALVLTASVYGLLIVAAKRPYRMIQVFSWLSDRLLSFESLLLRTLFDINSHYSRAISVLLLGLVLLPLFAIGNVWLIGMAGLSLLLLPFTMRLFDGHRGRAIQYGMLHLLVLGLLFVYLTMLLSDLWTDYLAVVSSLALGWVVLTMLVGHTRRMLTLHSFEVLLVIVSWVLFFVVMPILNYAPAGGQDIRIICVYAIPLLLLCKLCLTPAVEDAGQELVKKTATRDDLSGDVAEELS